MYISGLAIKDNFPASRCTITQLHRHDQYKPYSHQLVELDQRGHSLNPTSQNNRNFNGSLHKLAFSHRVITALDNTPPITTSASKQKSGNIHSLKVNVISIGSPLQM